MKMVDSLGMCAALLWPDLFLKPRGIPTLYGSFNRMFGRLALRGVALGLIHYKAVQKGPISAGTV